MKINDFLEGTEPAGLWPAEGAVSDAFLRLLPAPGIRWTATLRTMA